MATPEYVWDSRWPTLGFLVADWTMAHCVVPDGDHRGEPFELVDWQLWVRLNHYRVRPDAVPVGTRVNGREVKNASQFVNRRSQIVLPQKAGKGPDTAAMICVEAVGPVVFDGFAQGGEVYHCADHGCSCGWTYEYDAGEPMGRPWSTPLIQVVATSKDQTDNIYDVLKPMIDYGPLSALIPKTGEEFIRLPGGGEIQTVTGSAKSRLGQRVTFAAMDETGIWISSTGMPKTADTIRRGLSGTGGRACETTNAWDPSEASVAQQTAESQADDLFRFHPQAPAGLSFANKKERRKILEHVYAGSWWIDLDGIEGEALELMERDPAQAERFYGNRLVQGAGSWLPDGVWQLAGPDRWQDNPPDGTDVAGGFDGSENDDYTAIKLVTKDGLLFTPRYGPDRRPTIWNPKEWGGQIPRSEVDAAWAEILRRYKVKRVYCDPGFHDETSWESEIEKWSLEYGEDVFIPWPTNMMGRMFPALRRFEADVTRGDLKHDGCLITQTHVGNARKLADKSDRYRLGKPSQVQKIDVAVTSVLAHEAASDARAAGWDDKKPNLVYY